MTGRRIDPEVITTIEHLLRTTKWSNRRIGKMTGVGRGLVDDLKSGERADKHAAAEVAVAERRIESPTRLPIGADVCLACELRRRQRQGTPADDDSLALDLADEHRKAYLAMRIRAKARHEARDKNPKRGSLSTNL